MRLLAKSFSRLRRRFGLEEAPPPFLRTTATRADDLLPTAEPAEAADEPVTGATSELAADNTDIASLALTELVRREPTSVRLRNCIEKGARAGTLPASTIGEYLALGEHAHAYFLRVRAMGLKTVRELDQLVRETFQTPERLGPNVEVEEEPSLSEEARARVGKQRGALLELFGALTLGEALSRYVVSVRLGSGLAEAGLGDRLFAEVIADLEALGPTLLGLQNFGRRSLRELHELIGRAVVEHLREAGLPPEQAQAAQLLLLTKEAEPAEQLELESLTLVPPKAGALIEPAAAIDLLMLELREREQQVIERRYGFKQPSMTLDEIGREFEVTRERIRQIEAKALRKMRPRAKALRLSESVLEFGGKAWVSLAGEEAILLQADRKRLDPSFALALDILELPLSHWLDRYATRCGNGWCRTSEHAADLEALAARLRRRISDQRFPCALAQLCDEDELELAADACRLIFDRPVALGYVFDKRVGRRARRAAALHVTLASLGRPNDLLAVRAAYRGAVPADPCSTRDLIISLETHPQLFLETVEGTWVATGPAGRLEVEAPEPERYNDVDVEPDDAGLSADASERQTVVDALRAELSRRGPTRISELIDDAPSYLPEGRSVNSVGPTLLVNRDIFERPLPAIYALPGQVPSLETISPPHPRYLFDERQVRAYALARRAGEPWGTYPLWQPAAERLFCEWAKRSAPTDLLTSLLAVADIDAWPCPSDLKDEWQALARERARFCLTYPPRETGLALPELDRVLAATYVVKMQGRLGWVSANQVLRSRVTDHSSAGLLAILIALQVLEAPFDDEGSDWQMSHPAGPKLLERQEVLAAELAQRGTLSWDTPIGDALIEEASACPLPQGWVSTDVLEQVIGVLRAAPAPAPVLTLEEELERARVLIRQQRDAERLALAAQRLLGDS